MLVFLTLSPNSCGVCGLRECVHNEHPLFWDTIEETIYPQVVCQECAFGIYGLRLVKVGGLQRQRCVGRFVFHYAR